MCRDLHAECIHFIKYKCYLNKIDFNECQGKILNLASKMPDSQSAVRALNSHWQLPANVDPGWGQWRLKQLGFSHPLKELV